MTYTVLNALTYLIKLASFGRIVPVDEDHREYWTYKPNDSRSPWFIRLARGHRHFWNADYGSPSQSQRALSPAFGAADRNSKMAASDAKEAEVHVVQVRNREG